MVQKYCKILDIDTGEVQLGAGCPDNYYIAIGMELRDVEQSEVDNKWYITEKCPRYTTAQKLRLAKEDKINKNDTLRDTKLNDGVTYNNVLFDSDTDQKINLLAMYNTMSDTDTIVWYGKNNDGLLCTKDDLLAIGALITKLQSFVWETNAYIKEQIANATTIDELDKIDISYNEE